MQKPENISLEAFDVNKLATCEPKIHTIREDKNERWKPGVIIDFFINVRQKNMFRFGPKIPVVSTQRVYMSYKYNDIIEITVDDTYLYGHHEREQFAINDGFDNWDDFFNYFYGKVRAAPDGFYKAKLIHWTSKRY